MNYCTKCASLYTKPGTCNCYAVTALPIPPLNPWYDPYPTYPVYPSIWPPVITYSGGTTTSTVTEPGVNASGGGICTPDWMTGNVFPT